MNELANLEHIFHTARALPAGSERDAYLDEACLAAPDLRRTLDALLIADDGATDVFVGGRERAGDSVLKTLEARLGSSLSVCLDTPGPDGAPVKVTEEARTLSDLPGRYQMLGEIGRGGMGVVFKGRDQDLGRDVAMKVLKREYAARPDILARFVEEAQIGGQLQHPGIVPVYELGLQHSGGAVSAGAGERPYFAMKLIKGETLSARLARRKHVAEDRRGLLGVFEQVCQTVAYAHSRHVIHRDLKPANVMIGAFGEVQVVDWGFAKVLPHGGVHDEEAALENARASQLSEIETVRSGSGSGSQSRPGSMMGTPAYMPPEQAQAEIELLDERTDVFALGAILCELLTGSPPYLREQGDLVRQAAMAALEPARERLAGCGADEALVALATECLMPTRAARPSSAQEVAERMGAHLTSVEERAHAARVEAAEAKVRAEALKRTQRLGIGLTAAITIGLVVSLWFWREAEDQRVLANQAAEREALAAASAEEQRELAEARAAELDEIAWFQAEQLRTIETERMGAGLREAVLEALPKREREEMQVRLSGVNFTTIAAASLEANIFQPTITAIDDRFEDQPLVRARLLQSAAMALDELGRPDAALEPQRRALELRREELASEDVETLMSLIGMGDLLVKQGEYEEAETLIEEALETTRRVCGEDHPATLSAVHSWGVLLFATGRLEEAEPLFRQLVEAAKRVIGTDESLDAGYTFQVASLLRAAGRLDEAEQLYRLALERSRASAGPRDMLTLTIANNLSELLLQKGELDEAQELQEEAQAGFEEIFGGEHTLTLTSFGNRGLMLMNFGKYAEAETQFRRAAAGLRAVYGDDHRRTLTSQGNLGAACFRQGKLDEAEVHLRAAYEGFRRRFGERYERTVTNQTHLSAVQRDRGEYEDAEQLAREAARNGAEVPGWGEDFWRTAEARSLRGEALVSLERYDEAEPILLEAYETLDRNIPRPRRKKTLARTAAAIVDLYRAAGDSEQETRWQAILDDL